MKKILVLLLSIVAIEAFSQGQAPTYFSTLTRMKNFCPSGTSNYLLGFKTGNSASDSLATYVYDTTSTATGNDVTVIKPDCKGSGDKGRWIKWDYDISLQGLGVATYSGTTNGSGVYSVTYGTAYASTPKVVAQIRGGSIGQNCVLTSSTTSGFSVSAYEYDQTSILGITVFEVTTTPVTGATIDVLVFEQ